MGVVDQRADRLLLSDEQIAFLDETGYLHIPNVFSEDELEAMDRELMAVLGAWGLDVVGWTGEWRIDYGLGDEIDTSNLVGVEGVDLYSSAWAHAAFNPRLCDAMVDILGPNVEYHHTVTHVKPPSTGDAVPLHQDSLFYTHTNDRFMSNLVHIDDTNDENGCIRFVPGSHKDGIVEHVATSAAGPVVPYLDPKKYSIDDTVPVPARRGDVVCFNYHAMHGSLPNRTKNLRRLVRIGYRDPLNKQVSGEWITRPGQMVRGLRPRTQGEDAIPVPGRHEAETESRQRQAEARARESSSR
jgi:ectoine hydroxylase-related dioxygenase (phytanoyl-CoA dioxygenase family)